MEEKPTDSLFRKILSAQAAAQNTVARSVHIPSLTVELFSHKLLRGKWLVLSTAAVFALLAMMLGTLEQPLYRAQTSIEIQSPERNILPLKVSEPDTSPSRESFLQTQIRIIESHSLVERVLAKLSDDERARLLDAPHFWWTRAADQPVELIRQHISAHASRQSDETGIIDISYLSPDAVVGARFLNILTRELADFNVERAWHTVQRNRQWSERQIDDLRRKWEQSAQVLAEYSQISRQQQGPILRAAPDRNDSRIRQLRNKLAELHKEISQWQALYGPSGATVQNLKLEVAQTEAAIRQHKTVEAPQASAENPAPVAAMSPQAAAHWTALQKDADSNREIYEATAARLKAASVLTATQLGDVSVVDPALPAARLATPSQFLTGSLGAFIGLLLGIAFVALRDRFSNTFSEPALLGQYLGVPIFGAVPIDRFAQYGKTYDTVNQEPALQLNFETDIRTAEAFRAIRSSLLLGESLEVVPRRLVFTSAGDSEGATFVVSNLGAALAGAQRRVLLVDGNLRSPGLHKIFGADNEHGLADLLSRQIGESSMTSRDVIRQTQIPDLYLLSAGKAGARAPEILSSGQLPQLLREFATGFDLVLVDSAPVLPYADTRSLARAVDGVVLIVKAGSTNRNTAMEARNAVSQDGSPVIGAILTEWDAALSASA